jgi:hypothetical protein
MRSSRWADDMDVNDDGVGARVEEDGGGGGDSEQVKELKVCDLFLSSQRSAIHVFL